MSSVFVDGTTPLDAAHMNALQQKVEKGVANGYASLDGTTKVPIAQLPASATGVPVPTVVNGQWLKGVGGAAVWQPIVIGFADLPGGIARAGARVNANGTLQGPGKAMSVARTAVGSYTVTTTFSSGNMAFFVTPWSQGYAIAVQLSGTTFSVGTFSQAGAATDLAFNVVVFDMDTWP